MGWELEEKILQEVKAVKSELDSIKQQQQTLSNLVSTLAQQSPVVAKSLVDIENELSLIESKEEQCCTTLNNKLDQLIKILIPPPAVKVIATVILGSPNQTTLEGETMPKKAAAAAADLVLDETTGTFTVTLSFEDVDDAKVPTPAGLSATYTDSTATPGPDYLTLTPSADTSSCAGSVNQTVAKAQNDAGVPLPTGVTISGTATWTGLASPVSFTASPALDLVAGAAGQVSASVSEP
jgi:hypothetical protein